MRLISQTALVLGRIAGLKEQKKQTEALELIDEYLGRELRLRTRLAMGLSDDDLLAMFTVNGVPNAESVAVIAALLQEEAELLEDMGNSGQSVPRFAKALRLNIYLLRNGVEIEGWDIGERVEKLIEVLSPYIVDVETKRALWAWHEWSGRFTEAEDMLYELQEEEGATYEEGDAFYGRLSILGDEALEQGGIPREELEEGRRQWGALMKEKIG